jgi:VanZ family protein
MIKKNLFTLPWIGLAIVAFVTLCPITLRPHIFDNSHIEHFSAFAIIGLMFCMGYPRQTVLIAVVVLGAATLLEVMQLLTSDRHGRIPDLEFKLAGAVVGIAAGKIAQKIAMRRV